MGFTKAVVAAVPPPKQKKKGGAYETKPVVTSQRMQCLLWLLEWERSLDKILLEQCWQTLIKHISYRPLLGIHSWPINIIRACRQRDCLHTPSLVLCSQRTWVMARDIMVLGPFSNGNSNGNRNKCKTTQVKSYKCSIVLSFTSTMHQWVQ